MTMTPFRQPWKRKSTDGGEPAGVAGVGVVDEDAVAVADDAVRVEEEANRDGPAVGVAASPHQDRVVVLQLVLARASPRRRSASSSG